MAGGSLPVRAVGVAPNGHVLHGRQISTGHLPTVAVFFEGPATSTEGYPDVRYAVTQSISSANGASFSALMTGGQPISPTTHPRPIGPLPS